MTFLEAQTLTSDWLDDTNNDYFTLAIVKQWINLAQIELQKLLKHSHKDFYTTCVSTNTVNGQRHYALPSDFMEMRYLERVTEGSGVTATTEEIGYVTLKEGRNILASGKGEVSGYTLDKSNIILFRVPDSVYELRLHYVALVTELSADGDIIDAPDEYSELVPILAARNGFLKDGRDMGPIQAKMAEYKFETKQYANDRNASGPRMVRTTRQGFGGL